MIFSRIISVLFATLILFTNVSAATAPTVERKVIPLTIQDKIVKYANEYNADAEVIRNVMKCESSFNPNAVGDNNTSFGLSQIHLPAHPDITREQALDEDFAIIYMAKNITNNPGMWSCYNMLYK
jgi:soluble lytic murein transglycosylase-like protein